MKDLIETSSLVFKLPTIYLTIIWNKPFTQKFQSAESLKEWKKEILTFWIFLKEDLGQFFVFVCNC